MVSRSPTTPRIKYLKTLHISALFSNRANDLKVPTYSPHNKPSDDVKLLKVIKYINGEETEQAPSKGV